MDDRSHDSLGSSYNKKRSPQASQSFLEFLAEYHGRPFPRARLAAANRLTGARKLGCWRPLSCTEIDRLVGRTSIVAAAKRRQRPHDLRHTLADPSNGRIFRAATTSAAAAPSGPRLELLLRQSPGSSIRGNLTTSRYGIFRSNRLCALWHTRLSRCVVSLCPAGAFNGALALATPRAILPRKLTDIEPAKR